MAGRAHVGCYLGKTKTFERFCFNVHRLVFVFFSTISADLMIVFISCQSRIRCCWSAWYSIGEVFRSGMVELHNNAVGLFVVFFVVAFRGRIAQSKQAD